MSAPCPQEVIDTGRLLLDARKLALAMSDKIDVAITQLDSAVVVMAKDHGAKAMQAGATLADLRQAQAAYGLIMRGHENLRQVLVTCDVDQPTDAQLLIASPSIR